MAFAPVIARLPDADRERVEAIIVKHRFRNFAQAHREITAAGFKMSPMTVARHGKRMRERHESIHRSAELAKAIVETVGPDNDTMAEAALRLAEHRIFELLMASDDANLETISQVARSLAEASRAGVRLRAERGKWERKSMRAIRKISGKHGISQRTITAIRAAMEGAD